MKTAIYLLMLSPFLSYGQQPSAIIHADWISNDWQYWSGHDYYYNSSGDQTTSILKYFIGNNDWYNDERITTYYTTPGNQVASVYYERGLDLTDTTTKIENEYNGLGQRTVTSQYSFVQEEWILQQQSTLTYYGSSDDIQTEIVQILDENTNVLVNNLKYEYTYPNSQTQYVLSYWDGSDWVINFRQTTSYNGANQPVTDDYENYVNNQWVPGSVTEYNYTPFGKLSDRRTLVYSDNPPAIATQDSTHYTYNADETIDYVTFFMSDTNSTSLVPIRRDKYIYDSHLEINEAAAQSILLYPNPSSDRFTIATQEAGLVSVIDLSGRTWKEQQIQGTTTINVQNWPQGSYIVQFRSSGGVTTNYFVKD